MRNIALALSGGGFRAAAFSLGTLSYLNSVNFEESPLLHKVKFIGSTSGGSITNSIYSSLLCQQVTFNEIYHQIYTVITGENLIKKVFEILEDDKYWRSRPHKSRNLINAFAIAYDQDNFLNGAEFGLLTKNLPSTHLEEVTFNATEFANGLSFRFQSQNQGIKHGSVGNNYIYFLREAKDKADQLKLSDILACSSCFPGGFEPFLFPDDFSHSQLDRMTLSESITYKTNPFTIENKANDLLDDKDFNKIRNRFGLMDGGIADNQAIDSVLRANARRDGANKFDMILATDVSSYFIDGYTLPIEKKTFVGKFRLGNLIGIGQAIGFSTIIMLLYGIFCKWQPWFNFVLPITLLFLLVWLWINNEIEDTKAEAIAKKSTWGIIMSRYLHHFNNIRYSALKQMLAARTKSVLLLADDIYLKQLRSHFYKRLYADKELSRLVVSNAIYDLSAAKRKAKNDPDIKKELGPGPLTDDSDSDKLAEPSTILIAVAEYARSMPTTLWFDNNHHSQNAKAAIIATGQFTTCYNLIKHIDKLKDPDSQQQQLRTKLQADWEQFNQDPYYLYNQLGSRIKGFIPVKHNA